MGQSSHTEEDDCGLQPLVALRHHAEVTASQSRHWAVESEVAVGQGWATATGQAGREKETNLELRGHQELQQELVRVRQAAQDNEKEIAALVAQEDYSGAAKAHSLLIWLQEEHAGLRQSGK